MIDKITVIRSHHLLLAKRIHADGRTEPYGKARTIDLFERPVGGLDALHEVLKELIHYPQCAVVYGAIVDPGRVHGVRRLAYPDAKTGDEPTLRPTRHHWVALDVDGIDKPAQMAADDLVSCGKYAAQQLPAGFGGARCLVQASAGHGLKPGCRLRMWFWLDRFVTGDELKHWCAGYPIDPCTFRTAQPIYTAAPVFVGREDHLTARMVDLPGTPEVHVPPADELKPPKKPRPASGGQRRVSQARMQESIDQALDRVRCAPEGRKHYVLRDNARLLGGIAEQAGVSDSYFTDLLLAALPSTVRDWNAARDTAEWGLAIGREKPITLEDRTGRDQRHRDTARAAFRLLMLGMSSIDLLACLHEENDQRSNPLPEAEVNATALWCAQKAKEKYRNAA